MRMCKLLWSAVLVGYFNLMVTIHEAIAATLGDRASSLTDELKSFGGLAKGVFVLVGLVLIGTGLIGMRKAHQRQEGIGGHVLTLVIGVCLASITLIITMSSESFTGSTSTDLEAIGL